MLFAGGIFTSCKKQITGPPQDTTKKKCDTCTTDTSHHPPCDTCNLNKDSLAHAFVWTEYINKIPGETNLTGVWVFGPNDIMICANSLYHFDGTNFTLIHANRNGSNTTLDGGLSGFNIFAFSKTEYWLVHGSIAFHTIDGLNFDDFRPGSSNACWGSAPNDVFVVGNSGQIHHFDGTNFTQMTSNTTKDLRSVWGTSSSDVWAGGSNLSTGSVVLLHYDGTAWSNIDLSQVGQFGCAGCESVGSVWAVDSSFQHKAFVGGGRIHRETNNSSWVADNQDSVGNKLGDGSLITLAVISGNSSTDFMTAGDWGFVSHWNGKTWKRYDAIFNSGDPNYGTQAFNFNGNTACIVGFKDGQSWMVVGTRKQ